MVGVVEPVGDRPHHHRPLAEQVDHGLGRLLRVALARQQHDESIALGRAQRIHAGGAGHAAYLVEDVGLGPLGGGRAQHDGHLAPGRPAQGAGAGEDGLVGLRAQHRVHHERLQPGVPGAADLGGAGVDLGRRERDLPGVPEHRGVDVGSVGRVDDVIDVALDHLDGEPHQVDGLLEVDHAGEGAGRGPEHRGGEDVGAGGRLVGVLVPVDEPADAGLDDEPDPGAVLGAEVLEPGQVVLHPGGRPGAQRAGRPLQCAGGARPWACGREEARIHASPHPNLVTLW